MIPFIAGYGVMEFQLKLVYPLSVCSLVALAQWFGSVQWYFRLYIKK